MGDNGAALLRGKGTLYEFGIHVPLIMRWPGKIKPGRASSELISGEDLAPTFLEACGVTVPKEMTGVSAHKILRDERAEGRNYLFAERGAHHIYLPKGSASFDLGRCVVGRRYKFIYNALARNTSGKLSPHHSRIYFAATRPMYELYDLEKDTGEFENLVGRAETAAIEKELRTVLIERMVLECDFLPLPISEDPVNGLR